MTYRSPPPHRRMSGAPLKPRTAASKYSPHQGRREVERRRHRLNDRYGHDLPLDEPCPWCAAGDRVREEAAA